ncbi:hypothetical protein MPSEU_000795600 [Mayamaea pseudoterrestris]|nr:hypothetical protein MPSEU_000795600 [Mayamaea pseudoterrestris]
MTTDSNAMKYDSVGILAMEVYTPRTFVSQAALEKHSGVPAGKYTIGLGQEGLALTGDAEDINSLCLTVVQSLLEKYDIDPDSIGRLEVGTETLVDKSKSTKTVLMSLFDKNGSGSRDMEGATIVNACYGGTAALLNAVAWVKERLGANKSNVSTQSPLAIVVAADIAVYARGPARPTSGVGAVALLVGANAPLVILPERATHACHVWDFFKPDHSVEYPVVNGADSQTCYYRALDDVYMRLAEQLSNGDDDLFTVESTDYYCFHAPYNKLVQKSFARLYLLDAVRKYRRTKLQESALTGDRLSTEHVDGASQKTDTIDSNGDSKMHSNGVSHHDNDKDLPLRDWVNKPLEETHSDRKLDDVLKKLSSDAFCAKLADANMASKLVGNTYTASIFFGLASLIDRVGSKGELTPGKNIIMFSYGSGALATMYRIQVREPTGASARFTIANIASAMNLTERLASRESVDPSELDHALDTRARMHHAGAPYAPVYPTLGRLFPGTYYLEEIDAQWRRTYLRIPRDARVDPPGSSLAPQSVLQLAQNEATIEQVVDTRALEAPQKVACVITGTAAGLPGTERVVFKSENLQRLIDGKQCIASLSEGDKQAMLEKNVVQLVKQKDGLIQKLPVDSEEHIIKLAAKIGTFDLSDAYGIPPGLAQTMDIAAQLAVASGMEALKDAGLVSGQSNDPNEWKLPEQFRNSTGVVYASSFPAMDAAVGEVMRFLQSQTSDANSMRLISSLRSRLLSLTPEKQLSDDDETAFARLLKRSHELEPNVAAATYEFDRKFLFRVLVLGNAQLAQLTGCRGPNTQTNAACAGTTQAIAMAQDMLISGRAERVVVVAGDNASGSTLLPWLGSGFRALGAACTKDAVEDAAMPFDKRRSGLLLGAGGIGLVLETEASSVNRQKLPAHAFQIKARLLHTQYSNSAFHGAALDRKHIASELQRFLADIELVHGISKTEIAEHGVYFSHETSTHASDASSCAGNEISALRQAFGDEDLSKLLILNTKGFTGHPMGVSFEDVAAVEVLMRQRVPPIPNYQEKDEYLGNLNISKGGPYACRYALRFAAGFGSQVAFALYAAADQERVKPGPVSK